MSGKVFGIRGVTETSKDTFYAIAGQKGLTPGEAFDLLLKNTLTPVNSVDTESLQADNTRLQDENTGLQTENTRLTDVNEALTNQLATTAQAAADLQSQLDKKISLTGHQFIFEPTTLLAKLMNRAIAYDIKGRKVERAKASPQWFTEKAIKFFIVNEYDHIQK